MNEKKPEGIRLVDLVWGVILYVALMELLIIEVWKGMWYFEHEMFVELICCVAAGCMALLMGIRLTDDMADLFEE